MDEHNILKISIDKKLFNHLLRENSKNLINTTTLKEDIRQFTKKTNNDYFKYIKNEIKTRLIETEFLVNKINIKTKQIQIVRYFIEYNRQFYINSLILLHGLIEFQ